MVVSIFSVVVGSTSVVESGAAELIDAGRCVEVSGVFEVVVFVGAASIHD